MAELRGFPPDRALWRLLKPEGGFRAFQDSHGAEFTETLAAHGIQARVTTLQPEELRFLELPTLVQLRDRTWIILEGSRKGKFRLDTADGPRILALDALRDQLSGTALDLAPALPPGRTLWARLQPLFLRHRRALVQAGAATLLLQLAALATPAITAAVMDRALPDGAGSLLAVLLAGLMLVTVHQVWLGWLRDRVLLFLGTRVLVSAERGFLEHVLRCPFPALQGRTLGELVQACQGFAAARELALGTAGRFLDGSLGLVCLAAMFRLLPLATLLVLLATALLALAALAAGRAEARLQARQVEAAAREHGLLMELVAGIGTLKAAGAEAKGLARWRGRCRQALVLDLARGRIQLGSALGQGLLSQALATGLFAYGGLRLLEGTLRPGKLFAYLQLGAGFTGAAQGAVQAGLALMLLEPQLAKAQDLLAVEPEPGRGRPAPAPVPVLMDDVWFRYSAAGPWVLHGYDLRLEPGQQRILTGPSGSGKSTVLRLLAGLFRPERGTVLVDDRPPWAARASILYLPQFVRLFGGSILDNLRVFSHGASLARLLEQARQTGLQALVDTLPMGYGTLLPPGGQNLSGGQRQLIALTGALASGRPLLLLDEALANLDALRAATLRERLAAGPWTLVAASHAQKEC